jgi:2-dehydropantoate 2-reductase
MRTLIVGAGATGGFFGGRLAQIGRDVTFLVRPARAEKLRRDGLEIISPLGNATIQAKLITAAELHTTPRPFDLIILATKAYSLEQAIEDLAPAVGPETTILPLLNGMRQLDMLDARFGAEHIIGGTCRINSDVDADGRVLQLSKLGDVTFGERNRERTPRIEQIHAELSGALFDIVLSTDILAAMWHKWYILASLNTICILPQGTVGEVVAVPHGLAFATAAIDECIAIATANGYPVPADLIASDRKRVTQPGSDLTSSMYRDMTKNAPVEADHVIGDLLARGEAHDAPAPLLRATYVRLKVYEAQRPAPEPAARSTLGIA